MKLRLRGIGFAVVLAFPLGGCLDAVVYPLNFEPTAYEDSLCQHGPEGGDIVNYGCVAGRALAPRRHHVHRHWRRMTRAHL